ncbi:hypothetical protein [Micromonospora sp. DPT]|uniref:hypothetical protein n=1 Tax=Micromonospora sp. DPT TaxID=3142975 RepID=UPI003207A666
MPVTKLGGQPVWLGTPQWPVSRSLGEPMTFIGQFRLDSDGEGCMAYLFMTDGEDYVDGTWEPEGGENAVIIQPDGSVPAFVAVTELGEGPSWPVQDHLPVHQQDHGDERMWEFLGGEPVWLQGDETPGPGWQLIGQLTDRLGHNFGDAGIGYIFVSADGAEGRFLWQCG